MNATLVCIIPKCQIFQVSMVLTAMFYVEVVLLWLQNINILDLAVNRISASLFLFIRVVF